MICETYGSYSDGDVFVKAIGIHKAKKHETKQMHWNVFLTNQAARCNLAGHRQSSVTRCSLRQCLTSAQSQCKKRADQMFNTSLI